MPPKKSPIYEWDPHMTDEEKEDLLGFFCDLGVDVLVAEGEGMTLKELLVCPNCGVDHPPNEDCIKQ